jgi:hypothetical protein
MAFAALEEFALKETMATLSPVSPSTDDIVDSREHSHDAWSVRRTAAFVIAVCGAFWLTTALLAAYLIQVL